MNKADRAYLNAVTRDGCVLCEHLGRPETPGIVHHQRTGTGAGRRADHRHVACLCVAHHTGMLGIHGMGRKAFERRYGITELELVAMTARRANES